MPPSSSNKDDQINQIRFDEEHHDPVLAIQESIKYLEYISIPRDKAFYDSRRERPKKKKGKKQLKITTCIKRAQRNAIPKNFQGYPIEKCQYAPNLKKHVFVPSSYARKTLFTIPDGFRTCCSGCFLTPCITEEVGAQLLYEAQANFVNKKMSREENHDAICRFIRVKLVKVFNKSYLLRSYPGPNDIPACAVSKVKRTLHEATNLIKEECSCSSSYSDDEDGDLLVEL